MQTTQTIQTETVLKSFSLPAPENHRLSAARLGSLLLLLMLTAYMLWPADVHARNVVSREQPAFPSDALDDGIDSGSVKVRLSVAADGSVSNVDILDADPKGYFEKAVKRALSRWKYEPGAAESIEAVIKFED